MKSKPIYHPASIRVAVVLSGFFVAATPLAHAAPLGASQACSNPKITQTADYAIKSLFNVNITQSKEDALVPHLKAVRPFFTKTGHQEFVKSIDNSGLAQMLKNGMRMWAIPNGNPVVSGSCSSPVISYPIKISFLPQHERRLVKYGGITLPYQAILHFSAAKEPAQHPWKINKITVTQIW